MKARRLGEIVFQGERKQEKAFVNKALWTSAEQRQHASQKIDWRKRMSDNVAFALLTYTGLQIFVTMTALKSGHGSIMPYFALVVLVAAIIPGCRLIERRWETLSESDAHNPELADRFRRDRLALWLCAIGLPFALTAIFKGVAALF